MQMLKFLAVGQAAGNNPHAVTNAVVAGLPESAHVMNPDSSVQTIIDRAQSTEHAIPGEVTRVVGLTRTEPKQAVQQVWNNVKRETVMLEHVPIPWLEG